MRDLAVCLVGQLRGVCGWQDLSSFFEVFLASFKDADVFLTVTDEECGRAHEFARLAKESNFAERLGVDIQLFPVCLEEELKDAEDLHWMEAFPKSPAGATYYDQRKIRSLLLPAKHMKLCGELAEQQANKVGGYRWGARVRPDCLWSSFPRREEVARLAPPLVLANFVPLPIQGVVEDQFLLASWPQMQVIFAGFYDFLSNSSLSWGEDVAPPWCTEHATLRSTSICQELFVENFLEMLLRRELRFQERKLRSICFDKTAPCNNPRTDYCSHLHSQRHAHGFHISDKSFYDQFDRDYFLTAPGHYADFDSHLAVRLARFFRDEVFLLGSKRPAKVLDLGCGRGSYVEAFAHWGLAAIGVDGDAVIRRSLPKNGLVWDLTKEFSLSDIFFFNRDDVCQLQYYNVEDPDEFSFATMTGTNIQDQATAYQYYRHLCCGDFRCEGFTASQGGTTFWESASPDGKSEDPPPSDADDSDELHRGQHMLIRVDAARQHLGKFSREERKMLSFLAVKFESPDWVLSLGVGQHIPGDLEHSFVENVVRHAVSGIVISWGQNQQDGDLVAANAKAPEEVADIFRGRGFEVDLAASQELRRYAGLGYGGPRDDILVLRRAYAMPSATFPASLQLSQHFGKAPCILGETFGLVPPFPVSATISSASSGATLGRMWVDRGCRGLFVFEMNGQQYQQFCVNPVDRYKECNFFLDSSPDEPPRIRSCLDKQSCFVHPYQNDHSYSSLDLKWHGSADHFVPTETVWLGQPQLNMVFFKFARWLLVSQLALTDEDVASVPSRSLALEWTWLWTNDWTRWLWVGPGRRGEVGARFLQTVNMFVLLGEQLAKRSHRKMQGGQPLPWLTVHKKLSKTFEATSRLAGPSCYWFRSLRQQQAAAWRRLALLQSSLARKIARQHPAAALQSTTFVRHVLPRLLTLLLSLRNLKEEGHRCRFWPFRKLKPTSLPQLKKALKLQNADEAWYLYRLAALDTEHI